MFITFSFSLYNMSFFTPAYLLFYLRYLSELACLGTYFRLQYKVRKSAIRQDTRSHSNTHFEVWANYRLWRVFKNISLEGLNQFHGANLTLSSDVDLCRCMCIYRQIIFLALLHHNTTTFHFVVVCKCHNGRANRDILSVHLPCQVVNINAYWIKLRCKLSPIYFIL